jgi:hypothetical protein
MSHRRLTAAVWSLALLAATSPVRAQQPPELPPELELNVEAQEPASPSDDGFVAKMRRIAKEWQLAERLNGDVDGWYPRLGGMTTGSGFAIGPGYRTHVFDGRTLVDLSAAFTYKGYKAVDAKAEWLHARYDRAELWTNFRYQDFPQEDFFGLGVNTPRSTRTNYALESTDISALGIYHVQPWMRVSADIGSFSPTIGRGTDSGPRPSWYFPMRKRQASPRSPIFCIPRSPPKSTTGTCGEIPGRAATTKPHMASGTIKDSSTSTSAVSMWKRRSMYPSSDGATSSRRAPRSPS